MAFANYTLGKVFLATTFGISGASAITSICLSLSYMAIPSLLSPGEAVKPSGVSTSETPSNTLLAKQWRDLYEKGKAAMPPVAGTTALSWLYAAYVLPQRYVFSQRLYVAAAVASVSIVPFTLIFMGRTNDELAKRSEASDASSAGRSGEKRTLNKATIESTSTPDLMRHWITLNAIRAALPATAVGCSVIAFLGLL